MRILIILLFITACSHQPVTQTHQKEFTWLSPADKNLWTKRVLTANPCPPGMQARFTPDKNFPTQVCEATFARGEKDPKRIVIFGDTGCRIKTTGAEAAIQGCNDPKSWPFAQVAASAAAWKPDLVIHVGDYHYRDSACPPDHPECAGSVTGDREGAWLQDFFAPAEPLLKAAPWIFVRGNHEICARAGHGWFHYLAPGPDRECTDKTGPYVIQFPKKDFLVVDSGVDENIQPSLANLPKLRTKTWLLTHRPLLTADADESTQVKVNLPKQLLKMLSAAFVGHVHTVALDQFKDDRPPEFILGNGGSKLAAAGPTEAQEKAGATTTAYHDFGFTSLEQFGEDEWQVIIHDREGKNIFTCKWNEARRGTKALICRKPSKLAPFH